MPKMVTGSKRRISFAQVADRPATPTMSSIGVTSFAITYNEETTSDPTLTAQRTAGATLFGNKTVAGNIAFAYKPRTLSAFINALFGNARTSGTVKSGGTVVSPFLFESVQLDAAVPYSESFANCLVNTMSLKVEAEGAATVEIGFMGTDYATSTTLISASPTAIAETAPFRHLDCVFKIAGAVVGAMTTFSLEMTNNGEGTYFLGSPTAGNAFKNFGATGSFAVVAENITLMQNYLAHTKQALVVEVSNGTKKDVWTVPNMVITGISNPLSDDGIQTVTVNFNADPDASFNSVYHQEVDVV